MKNFILYFLTIASLCVMTVGSVFAQSTSATYAGDIPTSYQGYDPACNGPATTLVVTIPAGDLVTGIDIAYDMTAATGAYMSEQESFVYYQEGATGEASVDGVGSTAGVYSYSRTAVGIASGISATGTLTFEMHADRSWGSSAPNDGCSLAYNKVDDGTWTITVYHEAPPSCSAPFSPAAANVGLTTADITWGDGIGCVANQTITVSPAIAGSPFAVACGTESLSLTGLTAETEYTVTVANDCAGTPSEMFTFTSASPGDNCGSAVDLGGETSPFIGNTCAFANDFSGVACLSTATGPDMLFSIEVPDGFELSIGQVTNGYDSRHRLAYGGVCPGDTEVGCVDDPDTGTDLVFTNSTGSTQTAYWIQSAYSTGCGDFELAWTLVQACNPPTAASATGVTNAAADLAWTDGAGCTTAKTVTLSPAVAGSPFSVACGTGALSLTGLDPLTEYTATIANDCGAFPGVDVVFTTLAACDAPTAIAADNITLTAADITWIDGPGCTTAKTVTVDPAIAGSPFSVACGTQMLSLTGLTEATSYTVTIANDCGVLPSGDVTFSTETPGANCSTAVVLPTLAGGGTHSENTTIAAGTGGGVGDTPGAESAAWFSFTPTEDGTIDVSSCLGGSDTRLWIHDNCAGPSIAANDDSCPFASDGTGSTYASEVSGLAVTSGTTYYIEWDDNWNAGPFDWSLTFAPPAIPCDTPPSNIVADATDATSVLMTWDAVAGTSLYQVKYRERGTTAWTKFGTVHTQRNITGLDGNKQYQYKVRRQCDGGGWSDYSDTAMFPSFYSSTCAAPTGVSTIYLDNTSFKVRWDDNGEVKGRVRYREVGSATWLIKYGQAGKNFVYLPGLVADADYEYRVRVNCNDDEWSPYNTLYFHNLVTAPTRMAQELTGVRVYPNPTSDVLNITYDNELGAEATVEVFDILGRAIISKTSNDSQITLDVNQLTRGSYVVSIMADGKQSIQKFVKK